MPARPDPDALVAKLQAEQAQAGRGKLRIYFGSNAGVGKSPTAHREAETAKAHRG